MSTSGFLNQTFDDRDTDRLRYQGFWFLTGSWNATSVGESGTLSSSNDPNANVTFTFPVPAMAFYYYGIQRSQGGLYEICIDCDPRNEIWLPIDALNVTDNGQNPPVILFSQAFKTASVHEIIIRNANDTRINPSGNSQITIDRIDLEVVNPNATPTASAAPAPISPSSSGGPGKNSAITQKASEVPIGAILGGVLGSVAMISLVVLLVYWYMNSRKREARARANIEAPSVPGQQSVRINAHEPPSPPMSQFDYSSGHHINGSSSQRPTGFLIPPTKADLSVSKWVETPAHSHPRPSISSTSILSSSVSTDLTSPTTSSQGGRRPRREMDGGPLPLSLEEEEEDDDGVLPPEYGQVFGRSRRNTRSARNTTVSSSSLSESAPPSTPNSSALERTNLERGSAPPLPPKS